MKRYFKYLLLLLLFFAFIPNVIGLTKDIVSDITGVEAGDKVNIHFFYSKTCSHCHEEMEYLKKLDSGKYKEKIKIYYYEVTENEVNNNYLLLVKEKLNVSSQGVPFTVIGEKYLVGYTKSFSNRIDNYIDLELGEEERTTYNIPLIGEVDAKDANLSFIAVILGFIDGFNPCAMWVLLLLISMCLTTKNRKKMLLVGFVFIFTSGLVYFLSMLGLGLVIDIAMVSIIRDIIALVAIVLGIYNLYVYIKTRKDNGCHVVDAKKRKTIISRINKILDSKGFLIGLIGTIGLAISVNLVELACSLGFPSIFLEILTINGITGLSKVLYLFLYILFYLIDDIVVFLIAVFTLRAKGISTKYGKLVNLIGGILMIIMGILLIFKPEWVMLNF